VAFPAYAIAYRYRSRLYRTVISGEDPACVIGQTPISVLKVALLVALILAGFAVAMVGLILGSM
jgi:ABC-type Fe3+-siderophore transport system permease subunit